MTHQLHLFDLAELNSAIATTEFAGHLHHLVTTPSTNSLALEAAHAGARHGVWIADQQTAGRGRGTHAWHSPAGTEDAPAGLYMTALVSPPIPMRSALRLSFTTAIAVQSAISSVFGFERPRQIDIRWPNDLILNGRKCGGILIETSAQPAPASGPAMLHYAAIGIGINLNQTTFPPELDPIATSLRKEMAGRELHGPAAHSGELFTRSVENSTKCRREPLAAAILIALDTELRRLATGNQQPTAGNLSQYSTWLTGKRVRVEATNSAPDGLPSYTGTTAGLDPQGFLLVKDDAGNLRTVLSGGLREP
jgi:BirA family biotin operon repressor/biotin-[acetyl-CoA-carboxylase] ligase